MTSLSSYTCALVSGLVYASMRSSVQEQGAGAMTNLFRHEQHGALYTRTSLEGRETGVVVVGEATAGKAA